MKLITEPEFKKIVSAINKIVSDADPHSTLNGLEITATAFAALLDVYAKPNPENKDGMCDDPKLFREHFCLIIMRAGSPTPAATEKGGPVAKKKKRAARLNRGPVHDGR